MRALWGLCVVVALAAPAWAADAPQRRTAVVTAASGTVEVEEGGAWRPVRLLERLPASARLRTADGASAELAFPDGAIVVVGSASTFVLATGALLGAEPVVAPVEEPTPAPVTPATPPPVVETPPPAVAPMPVAATEPPSVFTLPVPPPPDILVPPGAAVGEQGGLDVLLQ